MDHGAISKPGGRVSESTTRKVTDDVRPSKDAPKSPAQAGDSVQLTDNAKLLERLEKSLATHPGIDEARVAEVKSAIESGEYSIDAEAIADAMLKLERAFGD